jgi:hypothetical protein
VAKSEATGDRLEEAKHINRSLSALGDVMAALAARDAKHVPFRNSKLTQLLQDSLCGQAKAMMFIHVSPEVCTRLRAACFLSCVAFCGVVWLALLAAACCGCRHPEGLLQNMMTPSNQQCNSALHLASEKGAIEKSLSFCLDVRSGLMAIQNGKCCCT